MATQEMDEARAEAFGERMLGVLNDSLLALLTSVGHQTGLFDAMGDGAPATSERIAAAAGCQERHVREWLGAMVTGGVVEYEPATRTYTLPPEHAASLTRAAGPGNMGIYMQYVPVLAGVEQELVRAFREGGGVPYSSYERFHRVLGEDSAANFDASLIDTILPLVPGLVERLRDGIDVLDVACGSGHALVLMAEAFPASSFSGYDISEEAIAAARAEAAEKGLSNVRVEVRDVATIDEPESYDLITTFDAIHDQARPRAVLRGIAAALKPDGVFLMSELVASSNLEENLDNPIGPFVYAVSTLHCLQVSLSAGGEGLGTAWGEQMAREVLAEAGLEVREVRRIEGDIFNNYFICGRTAA